MARRCLCARLLAAVQEDPRLRTLPLAARMLFLLVAEAAARSPVPGVLPFAGTERVSLLVSAPVTEVETHLETLRAEGLVLLPADGTLAVPLLVEAGNRADVARRNGQSGGRPRRGETREAYLQRKQGEMMLPIAGGAAPGSAETHETQPPKPASRATTTTSSTQVGRSGQFQSPAPEKPAWVSLGEEVAELAGLDQARGLFNFQPVRAWLEAGSTAEGVRAAIRRVTSRDGFDPSRVKSLGYFEGAVADERQRQPAAEAPARHRDTPDEAVRIAAIEARIARVQSGRLAA